MVARQHSGTAEQTHKVWISESCASVHHIFAPYCTKPAFLWLPSARFHMICISTKQQSPWQPLKPCRPGDADKPITALPNNHFSNQSKPTMSCDPDQPIPALTACHVTQMHQSQLFKRTITFATNQKATWSCDPHQPITAHQSNNHFCNQSKSNRSCDLHQPITGLPLKQSLFHPITQQIASYGCQGR